jgi:hypothetical protein
VANGMTLEKLDREFAKGGLSKAKYDAMKEFIVSLPTRVNGSTEENVRSYAKLAKLSTDQTAEVDKLIKTMDAGIERLRELIGKVEVEVKEGKHKGEKGSPLPRWFCNVAVKTAKVEETTETPAKTRAPRAPRAPKVPKVPAADPAATVPAQ